jgi:hypothetical protein
VEKEIAILNKIQEMPGILKAVEHKAMIEPASKTLHHKTISQL